MSNIPEVRKILMLASVCIKGGEVDDGLRLIDLAIARSFRQRGDRRPRHSRRITPEIRESMREMLRENPTMGRRLVAEHHDVNAGRVDWTELGE